MPVGEDCDGHAHGAVKPGCRYKTYKGNRLSQGWATPVKRKPIIIGLAVLLLLLGYVLHYFACRRHFLSLEYQSRSVAFDGEASAHEWHRDYYEKHRVDARIEYGDRTLTYHLHYPMILLDRAMSGRRIECQGGPSRRVEPYEVPSAGSPNPRVQTGAASQ